MPINMQSQYVTGPDGRTLTTTSDPYTPPSSGGGEIDGYLKSLREQQDRYRQWEEEDRKYQMLQRTRSEYARHRQQTPGGAWAGPGSKGGQIVTRMYSPNPENPKSAIDRALDMEQKQAKLAQLRAISERPPMRMTTMPSGAINGYTLDTNVMTGAQRQAYLPQNAGMENGGLTPDQMKELGVETKTGGGSNPSWNQKMQGNAGAVENKQTTDAMAYEIDRLRAALQKLQQELDQSQRSQGGK